MTAGTKEAIHAALEEGRTRTWLLADGLDDESLGAAATNFLSPAVWDLGHIANFEELWLVQKIIACEELREGYNDTYDAFKHERAERPSLDLLDREGARHYMEEVRARTRRILNESDLENGPNLVRNGFVHWMIILHEHQHQETLLQTITMMGRDNKYRLPPVRKLPAPGAAAPGWCDVPAGRFTMGTKPAPGVYDNESPAHEVTVPAFQIGKYPATTGQFLDFLEAGGYDHPEYWSERGKKWLSEESHHAPLYWEFDGQWSRIGHGCRIPIREYPDEILCHVNYFEAEAFAAWVATQPGFSGARLPTEVEWEVAAREGGGRNPWGDELATTKRANIDQLAFTTSRIGAYPEGAAPCGAQHMIGDVWEWTSSEFCPYEGFEAFPYDEYSKVFFGGDYRVLRGGSWATRAPCATGTFRNWDHPYRRQIFSGIRLARNHP